MADSSTEEDNSIRKDTSSENKDSREKGMTNSQETMTRPDLPTGLKASSSRPPKSLPQPDYQVFLCSSTGVSPLFPFQTLREGPRDTKGSSFAATKKEQGMTLPKQNNRKGWVGMPIKEATEDRWHRRHGWGY